MVVFDIMVSHFNMTHWHESGLAQHKGDLAAIQAAKLACKQRLLQQSPQLPAPASHTDTLLQPSAGQQSAPSVDTFPEIAMPSTQSHMSQTAPNPNFDAKPASAGHDFGGAAQNSFESAGTAGCAGAEISPEATPPNPQGVAVQPHASGSPRARSSPELNIMLPGAPAGPSLQQQVQLDKSHTESFSPPQSGKPPNPEATAPSGPVQPMSESIISPQPGDCPRDQYQGSSKEAISLGQHHQLADGQAKMTVRFDSHLPALPSEAAPAASQQHHHVRHAGQHSAQVAGERVHAGQSSGKRDEQQQWRVELEVGHSVLCILTEFAHELLSAL